MSNRPTRPIHTLRSENLELIIEDYFHGDKDGFLKKFNQQFPSSSPGVQRENDLSRKRLNDYLSGREAIGDRIARELEAAVDLKTGFLDLPEVLTAYIYVSLPAPAAPDLIKRVSEFQEVQEAAILYGTTPDVFIKLHAPMVRVQEIVLDHINSNPRVRHTSTHFVHGRLHWQREQRAKRPDEKEFTKLRHAEELTPLLDKDELCSQFMNRYPKALSKGLQDIFRNWLNHQADKVNNAMAGCISSSWHQFLDRMPQAVTELASTQILAVVVWKNRLTAETTRDMRYIASQKRRLQGHREQNNSSPICIKRIFVIPSDLTDASPGWSTLQERIAAELDAGIDVMCLQENHWIGRRSIPVDFGICDQSLAWELGEPNESRMRRRVTCYLNSSEIQEKIRLFEDNEFEAKTIHSVDDCLKLISQSV